MKERTLVILKPDCLEKKLAGVVVDRLQKADMDIVACKMIALTDALLEAHYAHILDKPYFPPLRDFMKRRSVIVMVFEGEGAIAKTRELLGPTDSTKAPKGTIRGDFGLNTRENIAHASDSPESAAAEIARFFSDNEIF